MKRRIIIFMCVVVFGISANSYASLVELNNSTGHVVFDNASNQYWIWDLNMFENQSYNTQIANISNLNTPGNEYFSFKDWHMATYADMRKLWQNDARSITSSFNPNYIFSNLKEYRGRYDDPGHYVAVAEDCKDWDCASLGPLQTNTTGVGDDPHPLIGAWVVASTPVPVVPEPISSILFVTGGMLLAGKRFFNKKR